MQINTSYPLLPISILIILFYSLSYAFSRTGIVSKTNHLKFWNTLLLLAFLITGIIGLLMVIKINYKLEMSFYEQLVQYHVGFGIGMAVIGVFHFWWHLNYYLQLFKAEKVQQYRPQFEMENDLSPKILRISAFMLGSTTIIAQILLLREFLTVFNGNELVIGVVLANWMVLTGIGAYLGKYPLRIKKANPVLIFGILILSVLPFTTTLLINYLKNIVFPIGVMISMFQIFIASFLILIPFCLLSGFLFTFIVQCFSQIRNKNETGSIYGYESIGSVGGGLLSGLLFIFLFSSIESLLVLIIINGLILVLMSLKKATVKFLWAPSLIAFAALALLFIHPEKKIRSLVYPNQTIVVSKDSPYGNIVITRRENMWSVYNNNVLLFDSENFMLNEEAVHFAMLQHPNPKAILLVSDGLSGQITEIEKYKPALIDYVEDNRWLLSLMKDTIEKKMGKNVTIHTSDPLRFIKKTTQWYDVAIFNLPPPSTLQANRFYTLEFFQMVKKKFSGNAVLSFGIPSPANYLNNEAVDLISSLYATLKKVFQNVIILPGEKNYFLASDAPLTYDISKEVQKRKIENRYVNQFYIDDMLLQMRAETILSAINADSEINQNLKPVVYHQQLSYWLSYYKGKYWIMAFIALTIGAIVFFKGNSSSKAMFITGFSASGLEILLLFGLQVYFGNIYLFTSFIITGFMLGLALGSFYGTTFKSDPKKPTIVLTQILIAIFSSFAAAFLFSANMAELSPPLVFTLYLLSIVLIGGLTGLQFSQVSQNRKGSYAEISGKTYSYDLIGSALGALAVALFLMPKLGIIASAIIICCVNLIFAVWLIRNKISSV